MVTNKITTPATIASLTGTGRQEADKKESPSASLRFGFVDGVRGFLCLWVVFSHMIWLYFDHGNRWLNESGNAFFSFFFNGHDRTAMFFVLSGFCLMIPVVKDGEGTLRGGVKGFMARRAARILPTYYAALALALASTYFSHLTKQHLGIAETSDVWKENFRWDGILSHIFLVHNLWPHLINTVYAPTWFMGIEADAYVLFALLWIPVWGWSLKRYGLKAAMIVSLVIGAVIGYGPFIFPYPYNLEWTYPHYLFLFSLGMVGSVVTMSEEPLPTQLRERIPWHWLALGALSVLVSIRMFHPKPSPLQDFFNGIIAVSLFILCAREYWRRAQQDSVTGNRPGMVRRFLESRLLVSVGIFSYSLFLSHHMLIIRLESFLESRNLSPLAFGLWYWIGGFVLVLIFGWVFYLCFEKPFDGLRIRAGSRIAVDQGKEKTPRRQSEKETA
jgi:peptidoglycan/LPS O-acetylase OafA/YrhL